MSVAAEAPVPGRVIEAWAFVWTATVLFVSTAIPGWYYVIGGPPTVRSVVDLAVVGTALVLLVRPCDGRGLALLAAFHLLQAAVHLPELANNSWISLFVNLAFLATVVRRADGGRYSFRAFQQAGRAVVIACYAFAFFAKLNVDFFDPSTSCAAQFYGNVAAWLPLPEDAWAARAALWGTLVVEGVLAAALLFTRGRWRTATVLGGIVFHFLLALDVVKSFVNFSAVMTAGLVLFLPAEALEKLAAGGRRRVRVGLAAGFVALLALGLAASHGAPVAAAFLFGRVALFAAFLAVLTPRILAARSVIAERGRKPALAALVVAGLAIVNGLSPYLGLKTRTSFDMYSNLRIEADRSNHLLVPRSLDLFGFLRDRVIVENVASEDLRERLPPGSEWPWLELARRAGEGGDVRIEYVREGIRRVHDPGESPRIEPPPWLLRKLLAFRPFGESTRALCVW